MVKSLGDMSEAELRKQADQKYGNVSSAVREAEAELARRRKYDSDVSERDEEEKKKKKPANPWWW